MRCAALSRGRPTRITIRAVAPNLLKETANEIRQAGEVIVGDITYLPMRNGRWCYPASFQEKFTRRIVGWQVLPNMTAQLVIDAFNRARGAV